MKILHIMTSCEPGAGRNAMQLHRGLKTIGTESKILTLYPPPAQDDDIVKFERKKSVFGMARSRLISHAFRNYEHTRPHDQDLFTDDRSIYDISGHPLVKEADILVLRWIAGMIDYVKFFSSVRKPVVWSLADANPFTGGCHILSGCEKYKTGCGSCPQLGSKDPDDLSRRIFKRKEKAYAGHNMFLVSPSNWFAERIRSSRLLFKNAGLEVIPRGVRTDVFIPQDKRYSRDLLRLPQDMVLILSGAVYKSKNKNRGSLIQAIRLLRHSTDISKIALVSIGACLDAEHTDRDIPIYDLGEVEDEALLSRVYNAADIFAMPSLEESFGQMALEAMSCGVAVIASDVGGPRDIIKPEETGLLVKPGDTDDLARKITRLLKNPAQRATIGKNARRLVEESYGLEIEARRYHGLFARIYRKKEEEKCHEAAG